jgi:hypothetical protein
MIRSVIALIAVSLMASVACTKTPSVSGTFSPTASPSGAPTTSPSSKTGTAAFEYDLGVRKLAGSFFASAPSAAVPLGQAICQLFKAGSSASMVLTSLVESQPSSIKATRQDIAALIPVAVTTLCPQYLDRVKGS